MGRDLHLGLVHSLALDPVSIATATTTNGATIDRQVYEQLLFSVNVGTTSVTTLDAANNLSLRIQHSDNGTDWSAPAESEITGALAGTSVGAFALIDANAETGAIYKAQYTGSKRYARVIVVSTGTHTNGTIVGATAILEQKYAA